MTTAGNSTTPHWPQPPPTRRVGVAGLTDFEAHFTSDPLFASTWNEVGSQLIAEGASSSQIDNAKTWFVNSVEGALPGVTGVELSPMRLFHFSNTYLALLFLVVAIDAVVFG